LKKIDKNNKTNDTEVYKKKTIHLFFKQISHRYFGIVICWELKTSISLPQSKQFTDFIVVENVLFFINVVVNIF